MHSFQDLPAHGNVKTREEHRRRDLDDPDSEGFNERYEAAVDLSAAVFQIFDEAVRKIQSGEDAQSVIDEATRRAQAAAEAAYRRVRQQFENHETHGLDPTGPVARDGGLSK